MNCPRCNMILAQGAQVCPNCHLNLQQHMHQFHQPGPIYGAPMPSFESGKEKVYRKILIAFAIVIMAEFIIVQVPYMFGFYSLSRIIGWLDLLVWAGIPLTISLLLPKDAPGRVVLIVFASIFILVRLIYAFTMQWSYYGSGMNDFF